MTARKRQVATEIRRRQRVLTGLVDALRRRGMTRIEVIAILVNLVARAVVVDLDAIEDAVADDYAAFRRHLEQR